MTFIGILVAVFSIFGVFLGGAFANADGFLTVRQMNKRGIEQGLPFIAHGGMWGDLIIVTPLIAVIVSDYSNSWSWIQITLCIAFGICTSLLMHWSYIQSIFPEAHVEDHKLTGAGRVHVVYMGIMLAIVFLFYFCTRNVPRLFAIPAGLLLFIHMVIGTHIPLGIWNPTWYDRRPDLTAYVTVVAAGGLLFWRTYAIMH